MYKNLAATLVAACVAVAFTAPTSAQSSAALKNPPATPPLKAAFVYVTPVLPAGWTRQHEEGRLQLQRALGDQVQTTAVENVPEGPDAERVIRDLALQPAVLPRDPHRVPPLLEECGGIQDQEPLPLWQHLPHPAPHAPGAPGRVGNEVMERLIRPRFGDSRQHRLHGLAGTVVHEACQIATRRIALDIPAEARGTLIGKRAEALQHCAGVGFRHARNRKESGSFVQVRNIESRRTET